MIRQLLIVAAPSGGGKTWFVNELLANRFPGINDLLGIDDFGDWARFSTSQFLETSIRPNDKVLVEYNSLRHYYNDPSNDEFFRAVSKTQHLQFITLWIEPERLARQRFMRDLQTEHPKAYRRICKIIRLFPLLSHYLTSLVTSRLIDSKYRDLLLGSSKEHFLNSYSRFYGKPEEIVTHYEAWLQFCNSHVPHGTRSIIVEYFYKLKILSFDEWRLLANNQLPTALSNVESKQG